MKSQVPPVTAVVIILVVIGIVAFSWIKLNSGGSESRDRARTLGMPPEVAAEFQKRLGGVTGPRGAPGGGQSMQQVTPGSGLAAAPDNGGR